MAASQPENTSRGSFQHLIDEICRVFEEQWHQWRSEPQQKKRPDLAHFLPKWNEPERSQLFSELLRLELLLRTKCGETPSAEDYRQSFPQYGPLIDACFVGDGSSGDDQSSLSTRSSSSSPNGILVSSTSTLDPTSQDSFSVEYIGRYEIRHILGEGAAGVVYAAFDRELNRLVAIKVQRHKNISAFRKEARILASLDHGHILPVYDVGELDDGRCFVVSKLIEGTDLATKVAQQRPSHRESAELVATIAEALHHAHIKRLVHRDVKPANILIDATGKSFLADFGLAMDEADYGNPQFKGGTVAYMSPEQARGEGHLVDCRSDIFSLGVVFYELLTGERPFGGTRTREVLERIRSVEPRPPRMLDDTIPADLERICLKALSKRSTERYAIALDMADDLRHVLTVAGKSKSRIDPVHELEDNDVGDKPRLRQPVSAADVGIRIMPKGLRAFDANDADFFLDLLPGPCDRDGLPESIRFWTRRIQEADAEKTFRVGLIYGPSGCGKSSLVQAGIIPRLSRNVRVIYIEGSPHQTEVRLLKALRKECPSVPSELGLTETLVELRRRTALANDEKILIILDQIEQWLHTRSNILESELVHALRQCDGSRLQSLILVRDDFWMPITRFLRELGIQLLEGSNSLAVDLFDPFHARKVLTAFGRSFGRLPDSPRELDGAQADFLDRVVTGLETDGKVSPVRLALFCEMVKDKPWTRTTLDTLGGMQGVGVAFLHATFGSRTAPPEHRLHKRAAQAVLKSLLPDKGTQIRGHVRPFHELLNASGYASSPRDFDHLLQILDAKLRLITPVVGDESQPENTRPDTTDEKKYYQLTHDYLVPALREWITREQKETWRGRTELMLESRLDEWQGSRKNRFLPSLWETLRVAIFARHLEWTQERRQMIKRAMLIHAIRAGIGAFYLFILVLAIRLVVKPQNSLLVITQSTDRNERLAAIQKLEFQTHEEIRTIGGVLKSEEGREIRNAVFVKLRQTVESSSNDPTSAKLRSAIRELVEDMLSDRRPGVAEAAFDVYLLFDPSPLATLEKISSCLDGPDVAIPQSMARYVKDNTKISNDDGLNDQVITWLAQKVCTNSNNRLVELYLEQLGQGGPEETMARLSPDKRSRLMEQLMKFLTDGTNRSLTNESVGLLDQLKPHSLITFLMESYSSMRPDIAATRGFEQYANSTNASRVDELIGAIDERLTELFPHVFDESIASDDIHRPCIFLLEGLAKIWHRRNSSRVDNILARVTELLAYPKPQLLEEYELLGSTIAAYVTLARNRGDGSKVNGTPYLRRILTNVELKDENRSDAARGLAKLDDHESMPIMLGLVEQDRNLLVRAACIESLGVLMATNHDRNQSKQVESLLERILHDNEVPQMVRKASLRALGRNMGIDQAEKIFPLLYQDIYSEAQDALQELAMRYPDPDQMIPFIAKFLTHINAQNKEVPGHLPNDMIFARLAQDAAAQPKARAAHNAIVIAFAHAAALAPNSDDRKLAKNSLLNLLGNLSDKPGLSAIAIDTEADEIDRNQQLEDWKVIWRKQ